MEYPDDVPHLEQVKQILATATYRGTLVNWHNLFQCSDHTRTGLIEFTEFRSLVRNYARVTADMVPDAALKHLFVLFPDLDGSPALNYSMLLEWMKGVEQAASNSSPSVKASGNSSPSVKLHWSDDLRCQRSVEI